MARCFLDFSLRSREPAVGLVARRRSRRHRRAPHQFYQAIEGVPSIALLGAMTLRGDHENTFAREPPAGQPFQPGTHVIGNMRRAAHVEAKLYQQSRAC